MILSLFLIIDATKKMREIVDGVTYADEFLIAQSSVNVVFSPVDSTHD